MKSPLTVVGGVTFLVLLVVMLILGLNATGDGIDKETKNALIIAVLGLVGSTIPSVLALYKAEGAQQQAKQTNEDIRNGVVTGAVKEAIHDMSENEEDPVVIVPQSMIETETYTGPDRRKNPNG